MTTMLQTYSFSQTSEDFGGFDGLLAASIVRTDKRKPDANRRQRRMTRRRRLS